MNSELTASSPPIGMALWLLKAKRLPDRVDWLLENGFSGVSLLQYFMDKDEGERREAAALIKDSGMFVTYHGNVRHKLTEDNRLDPEFVARMIDDVLWWHENTNGVSCCCSDPVNVETAEGKKKFLWDESAKQMRMMAKGLRPHGIRFGIENGFGEEGKFRSIADIHRLVDMCEVSDLGMLLDAAHANIHTRSDGVEGETDLFEYVANIPLDILEIHFSDNRGEKDEHKHLGYGNLDLKELFRALKARDFSGHLTVEVCLDIQSGQYGSDIEKPEEMKAILASRDAILNAW